MSAMELAMAAKFIWFIAKIAMTVIFVLLLFAAAMDVFSGRDYPIGTRIENALWVLIALVGLLLSINLWKL